MTVRTRGAGALLAVVASGVIVACDRSDGDGASRRVDILVLAIRDVMNGESIDGTDEALPVVYVVRSGEQEFAASVQADVAAELHEEIDVRFADGRDEVVQTNEPDHPVPDSGVLLLVDDIPEDGDQIDVPVEIYRSEVDGSAVVYTFAERSSSWIVTATSLVSSDV